jgi:hypothetical protein
LFWWSLLLPTLLTCPLLFCMCLHPTHCRACVGKMCTHEPTFEYTMDAHLMHSVP